MFVTRTGTRSASPDRNLPFGAVVELGHVEKESVPMSKPEKRGSPKDPSTGSKEGSAYLVQYGIFVLNPGSPVARALGCTCQAHDGSDMFACKHDCSMHGLAVLSAALEDAGMTIESFVFDRSICIRF